MDIKQRLRQMVDSTDLSYIGAATVAELCRDALAEIERLQKYEKLLRESWDYLESVRDISILGIENSKLALDAIECWLFPERFKS
jgi:peptide subunit release factor 1 (eRF1)